MNRMLNSTEKKQLIEYLESFVSENKKTLINEKLQTRTRHITPVLENIYQPHNASAVIRSAECFGLQDIHVIEYKRHFSPNKGIVSGSAKWVNIHRHQNHQAFQDLKNQGYKLVATTLKPGSLPLPDLDITQKTALLFGTEETGLSDGAHEAADEMVYIPMQGFTQSLNISVSAAICFYTLTQRLKHTDIDWALSEEEGLDLNIDWLLKSAQNSEQLLKHFIDKLAP